jgi:transposase InsO family protein
MKFAFVHAEKASFPVAALCRLLGVTRQGYYAFVHRPVCARVTAEQGLRERLQELHVETEGRYGSPRMQRALQAEGVRVGKRRIERAMQSLGIHARPRRRFRVTTAADPSHTPAENLLARDFTASGPDERWVTDITYVWTDEGWCYLAAILDLFSRSVVGWALDTTLSTSLPLAALDMALQRRNPTAGLLHHSDRGCQYTSADYRAALDQVGAVVSMSRKGNCWDNAVAESFFATLKTELVHRRRWATRLDLRAALFEYIEVFYNRRRLHSTLGYKTPAQVETEHRLACAA